MESKETQLINVKFDLEDIIMDVEGFKGMLLALEEALFYAGNWDKENYRYMVHHMYSFIHQINDDLKKVFDGIVVKEKSPDININSDQANKVDI